MAIKLHITPRDDRIHLKVRQQEQTVSLKVMQGSKPIPAYTGPYTVIPAQTAQVLPTNGLRMTGDVTVDPIPSNYGLITWNGSFLTVS